MEASTAGSRIEIQGIRAWGHHGVYDGEREFGQTFVVDLVIERDLSKAATSDDLADTTDYGTVAERVAAAVERDSFRLVEALTARLCDLVLAADEAITAVEVRVAKPDVQLTVDVDGVAVVMRRGRSEPG